MARMPGIKAPLLCLTVLIGLEGTALAQRIDVDFMQEALDRALLTLAEKGGIDVVFAHRYTEGVDVTCRILAATVDEALRCVLGGTTLQAERVRDKQWVILPRPEVARATEPRKEAGPAVTAFVEGSVVDAVSGEPLPGANVYLEAEGLGGTTNAEGRYLVRGIPSGSQRARFSYVGYESRTIELTTGDSPVVRLEPISLEADEIVVEGSRAAASLESLVSGHMAVLERRDRVNPALIAEDDLFQTLQWLPAVRQSGEVGGDLVVRGSGPDQSLHILDGAPLYHPWHTMGLFSTLQTEALKDVQLYAGSIPAEFGGRLSSVLDTRMKDGRGVEPRLLVSVGSMATQFVAEAPVSDQLSFMLAGRRSYADGLLNGSGLGTPERTTLQNSRYGDLNAKVTYRPAAGHEARFSYFQGSDLLPVSSSGESVQSIGWNRYLATPTEDSPAEYRWTSRLAGIQYAWLSGPRLLVTGGGFWSTYQSEESRTEPAPAAESGRTSLSDVGLKLDADYFAGRRHSWRGGIHLTLHDFAVEGSGLGSTLHWLLDTEARRPQQTWEAVAYVQDTWSVSRRLQVQPGLRVSTFGTSGGLDILPRLSARFAVHPDFLVLKAGASRQVQYVHQVRDRFADTYGLSASRWIPASGSGLPPASGYQIGLGLESRPIPALELSAEVYRRVFVDVLIPTRYDVPTTMVDPRASVLDIYHTGRQRSFGLELSGSLRLRRWRSWTSYAYGHSEEQGGTGANSERFVSGRFDVPHTGRAGVGWNYGPVALSVIGEIRSGYPVAVASASGPDQPASMVAGWTAGTLQPLPTYARLDARAGYQAVWLGMRWSLQMDLFNVTNRRNVIGHIYSLDGGAGMRSRLYGLPRLPLFKLRVEF